MGWRSRETMDVYTHTMSKRKALLEVVLAEEKDEAAGQEQSLDLSPVLVADQRPKGNATAHTAGRGSQGDEDEFSWYEE